MKQFILVVLIATTAIFIGCSGRKTNNNQTSTADKPIVTVSILPIKYFVEQIAGETVQISVLVKPGTSPEMYEPQPSTMVEFSKSNLYFAIGLIDFEINLEEKLLGGNTKYVNLSANSDLIVGSCSHNHNEHNHQHEHHHNHGVDPHIWSSCKEAKRMVSIIASSLSDTYPENAELYAKGANQLIAQIDSIDTEVKNIISNSNNKLFLIYHPALGYFARDYELTQISIEFEGKDPSAKGIVNTINAAKSSGITTILAQSQFDTKNALAIAAELNGNVIEIDPLAENWPEQMLHIAKAIAHKQ